MSFAADYEFVTGLSGQGNVEVGRLSLQIELFCNPELELPSFGDSERSFRVSQSPREMR